MHLVPQVHIGSWLAHQSISTFPSSQNFLEKELILNQRYLPHPNSNSIDFFFDIGYFSARNPNMLFISKNFVQKFSVLWTDVGKLSPGPAETHARNAGASVKGAPSRDSDILSFYENTSRKVVVRTLHRRSLILDPLFQPPGGRIENSWKGCWFILFEEC